MSTAFIKDLEPGDRFRMIRNGPIIVLLDTRAPSIDAPIRELMTGLVCTVQRADSAEPFDITIDAFKRVHNVRTPWFRRNR